MLNANNPAYSPVNYTTKTLYVECVCSCEGVIKGMYIVTGNVRSYACIIIMHAV